jgi:hypothetical protein
VHGRGRGQRQHETGECEVRRVLIFHGRMLA